MPARALALQSRPLSTIGLLAFGIGLALYQLTALVLGPVAVRQLQVSLTVPAYGVDNLSEPIRSDIDLVLGALSAPAHAAAVSRPTKSALRMNGGTLIASVLREAPVIVAQPPASSAGGASSGRALPPHALLKSANRANYHDADERSLRLARRR